MKMRLIQLGVDSFEVAADASRLDASRNTLKRGIYTLYYRFLSTISYTTASVMIWQLNFSIMGVAQSSRFILFSVGPALGFLVGSLEWYGIRNNIERFKHAPHWVTAANVMVFSGSLASGILIWPEVYWGDNLYMSQRDEVTLWNWITLLASAGFGLDVAAQYKRDAIAADKKFIAMSQEAIENQAGADKLTAAASAAPSRKGSLAVAGDAEQAAAAPQMISQRRMTVLLAPARLDTELMSAGPVPMPQSAVTARRASDSDAGTPRATPTGRARSYTTSEGSSGSSSGSARLFFGHAGRTEGSPRLAVIPEAVGEGLSPA